MNYIDEKFKDEKPEITVDKIIEKLSDIGININETWNESRIENCCSVMVSVDGGVPATYGKGITKAFARASAYGEFMERLESGLFFYKYQSFENDDLVNLHCFAPDKKYVTKAELLEDSEWMEPICHNYGLSKEELADQCQIYACSDKILTLPFYSLFQDKYVYLPTAFVEHMYSANGCCVGNTKEEAWVHALSEIFERHSNIEVVKSGKAAPRIHRSELKDFKVVNTILEKIDSEGIYDVEIMDYSCGKKFPVIAVRIINKKTKDYLVNVGADPVFEIAVERTLTEIFQGRNLANFMSSHDGRILNNLSEIGMADNILNQLESSNGLYTADFFAGTETLNDCKSFIDNSEKTNAELMCWAIEKFRDMGLQIYVRNNSFLGFHCYKFVVPGFSESRGERLKEKIPSYYFADKAAKTLRDIKSADIIQLSELLTFYPMIGNIISRRNRYAFLSGLPMVNVSGNLAPLHFAFAALKLRNFKLFNNYIENAIKLTRDDGEKDYLKAVKQWYTFINNGVTKENALKVIEKFYFKDTVKRLCRNLDNETLLDEFLVECRNCEDCKHKENCRYDSIREIIKKAGEYYSEFINGQNKENFVF